MGKGTILIIGAALALVAVIYLTKKAQDKKNPSKKKAEAATPKQQKTQNAVVEELMSKGYSEEEALQVSQSQLFHSGHNF